MNQNLLQIIHQMHAELCSSLADPKRLMILYTLADRPRAIGELCLSLGLNQPAVSRHLKILRERCLVQFRRDGQTSEYSLADGRIIQALDLLRGVMVAQVVAAVDNLR